MQRNALMQFGIAMLLSLFLVLPQTANADPIDIRQNSFGVFPDASYGDWSYLIQSTGYLGSHFTSFDPLNTGGPIFGPDDGISFGTLMAGSSNNTLDYTINFTSLNIAAVPLANPILDFYMWADWNNDGDWSDSGELFVDLDFDPVALAVVGGTITDSLTFSIPNFVSGDVFFNAVVSYDNNAAEIAQSFTYGEQEAYQVSVTPVPEPTTMLLFTVGLGAVGLLTFRRRKSGQC